MLTAYFTCQVVSVHTSMAVSSSLLIILIYTLFKLYFNHEISYTILAKETGAFVQWVECYFENFD